MRYNEDKILYEVIDYIKSTYNQHYSDSGSGFQIQDIFKELNIGREFAQANAIKYVCRYGKTVRIKWIYSRRYITLHYY